MHSPPELTPMRDLSRWGANFAWATPLENIVHLYHRGHCSICNKPAYSHVVTLVASERDLQLNGIAPLLTRPHAHERLHTIADAERVLMRLCDRHYSDWLDPTRKEFSHEL